MSAGLEVRQRCRAVTETDHAGFELFNRLFKSWDGTSWEMSAPVANFWAGGLASNLYWFTALRELRIGPICGC